MVSDGDPVSTELVPMPVETKYDVPTFLLAAYENRVADMRAADPYAMRQIRAENTKIENYINSGLLSDLVTDDPPLLIATLEQSFHAGDTAQAGFVRALDTEILQTFTPPDPARLSGFLCDYFSNGALRYTYSHMRVIEEYGSYEPPSVEEINSNSGMGLVYNMRNRSILADAGDWDVKAQFFIDEAQAWFEGADINPGATPNRVIHNLCMALACKKLATLPSSAFEPLPVDPPVESTPPPEVTRRRLSVKDIGRFLLRATTFWR